MLFAINARFKPGAQTPDEGMRRAFTDHLAQPLLHIRLFGVLHRVDGAAFGGLGVEARAVGDGHLRVLQYPRCAFLRVCAMVTHLDLVTFCYHKGNLS